MLIHDKYYWTHIDICYKLKIKRLCNSFCETWHQRFGNETQDDVFIYIKQFFQTTYIYVVKLFNTTSCYCTSEIINQGYVYPLGVRDHFQGVLGWLPFYLIYVIIYLVMCSRGYWKF